jgi:hypothetical protein
MMSELQRDDISLKRNYAPVYFARNAHASKKKTPRVGHGAFRLTDWGFRARAVSFEH